MAVKLHRCSVMWAKFDGHPCWRVQKALEVSPETNEQFALQAPYIWLGRGPNGLVSRPTLHGLGDATFPDGQRQDSLGSDATPWIDQLWLTS